MNLNSDFTPHFPCCALPSKSLENSYIYSVYLTYWREKEKVVSMLWRILYPLLKNVDKNNPEQAHSILIHIITIHTCTHSHQAEKHTRTNSGHAKTYSIFIIHTHTYTFKCIPLFSVTSNHSWLHTSTIQPHSHNREYPEPMWHSCRYVHQSHTLQDKFDMRFVS